MVDSTSATTLHAEPPSLRRHKSIATSMVVPIKLALPAPPTPPHRATSFQQSTQTPPPSSSLLNLELVSIKSPFSPSYTSLKDVLPSTNAAINSPKASSPAIMSSSGYEISIRNRLVKQAAWAYLQPMSASSNTSSTPDFLRRLWLRFSSATCRNPITACLRFIYHRLVPGFTRLLHRILHAIRGQVST